MADEEKSPNSGEYWNQQKDRICSFVVGLALGLGLNIFLNSKQKNIEKPKVDSNLGEEKNSKEPKSEEMTYLISLIVYVAIIVTILVFHFYLGVNIYWTTAWLLIFTYLFLFITGWRKYWFYVSISLFIIFTCFLLPIFSVLISFDRVSEIHLTPVVVNETLDAECESSLPEIVCRTNETTFFQGGNIECHMNISDSCRDCIFRYSPGKKALHMGSIIYDGRILYSSFLSGEYQKIQASKPEFISDLYSSSSGNNYYVNINTSPVGVGEKTLVIKWAWSTNDSSNYKNNKKFYNESSVVLFYGRIDIYSKEEIQRQQLTNILLMVPLLLALFGIIPAINSLRHLWKDKEKEE